MNVTEAKEGARVRVLVPLDYPKRPAGELGRITRVILGDETRYIVKVDSAPTDPFFFDEIELPLLERVEDTLMMERQSVQSSNLKDIGFDAHTGTLEVTFSNGTRYRYVGVPPATFNDFASAESKGSFFAKNIRGKYESERIDVGEAPVSEQAAAG